MSARIWRYALLGIVGVAANAALIWMLWPGYAKGLTREGIDRGCANIEARGPHAEAREWLVQSGRSIGGHGDAGSRAIVDDLYRRGAREVVAVGIEHDATRGLVVRLPEDREGRARLLRRAAWRAWSGGFEAEPDVGQSCAFLFWD